MFVKMFLENPPSTSATICLPIVLSTVILREEIDVRLYKPLHGTNSTAMNKNLAKQINF